MVADIAGWLTAVPARLTDEPGAGAEAVNLGDSGEVLRCHAARDFRDRTSLAGIPPAERAPRSIAFVPRRVNKATAPGAWPSAAA